MIKVNFVNLHSTFTALTPSHLWIIDIVKRLFRTLEQNYGSPEALRSVVLRPIRAVPLSFAGGLPGHFSPLGMDSPLASLPPLPQIHSLEFAQPLPKVLDPPQPESLTVLDDPCVENGKDGNFLSLSFQIADHSFSNLNSFTHAAKAVWTFRLDRAHRGDVFDGQGLQIFLSKRPAHDNRRMALQFVDRLMWAHVPRQQAEAEGLHSR